MAITKTGIFAIKPPTNRHIIPFVGIGAGLGAAYGIQNSIGRKDTADDRVTHWKARVASAETELEKQRAQDRLNYWKKVNRKSKRNRIIKQMARDTAQGAMGGLTAFVSLQRFAE